MTKSRETVESRFDISALDLTNDKIRDLLSRTNAILEKTTRVAEAMAKGDFSQYYDASGQEDERLAVAINQMLDNFKSVIRQAATIAEGDYRAQITPLSEKDELGTALFQMTNTLREMSSKNEQDVWIKNGQAGLANLMRGDLTMHALSKNVISYLAKYGNALIGTFYSVDQGNREILRLTGSYAYTHRKGHRGEIRLGEGLLGQCAIEKEMVVFSDVPKNYVAVNSSLGASTPHYIIIVPLLFESEVFGVIELGFYKPISETVMQLFKQVNESIAIAIKSTQDSERIKVLLAESNKQARELQLQQEELKAINEELEKQQNSLQKSNEELEYQTKRLRESEENIRLKNDALLKSTERLEQQKCDLEKTTKQVEIAKGDLEVKAKELELASKYKSDFLANMSHELRTPLNSLLILSESLSKNEEHNLTEEQVESAKIIYGGGKDLLNLINDILDLSKVEAGKLQIDVEEVAIDHITENLMKQFNPIAKSKSLDFLIKKADLLPTHLKTDKKRILQILKNFLSNAFKFTSHGSVTLSVHLPDSSVKFSKDALCHDNCVGFSVIDTGIGIPPDKQGIIFGAFQQVDGSTNRKYAGTGLGLSISKELAKLLSCEIQLKSDFGNGSCFTLYAPSEQHASSYVAKELVRKSERTPDMFDPAAQERHNEEDLGQLFAGRKILIVDDDMRNTYALSAALRKKGLTILMADNGEMALERLLAAPDTDLIVMDIMMPVMDGYEAMKLIRKQPKFASLPIIALTAKVMPEDKAKALECGANDFLTKPVEVSQLTSLIAILLFKERDREDSSLTLQ